MSSDAHRSQVSSATGILRYINQSSMSARIGRCITIRKSTRKGVPRIIALFHGWQSLIYYIFIDARARLPEINWPQSRWVSLPSLRLLAWGIVACRRRRRDRLSCFLRTFIICFRRSFPCTHACVVVRRVY